MYNFRQFIEKLYVIHYMNLLKLYYVEVQVFLVPSSSTQWMTNFKTWYRIGSYFLCFLKKSCYINSSYSYEENHHICLVLKKDNLLLLSLLHQVYFFP